MGIFNTRPRFQDRDMRQLSGDTITLSGDTNIDGVFRYKPGAITGYVLTSADGDGTVMWSPSTGVTSNDILFETGTTINSTQRKDVGNLADGDYNASLGGQNNVVSGGTHSVIAGGFCNTASGGKSTIGGGGNNTASGDLSTIGGGVYNTASSYHSTVGGGLCNTASGDGSTVGGGYCNTASGGGYGLSTVGGGSRNVASGNNSIIGGGCDNTASASFSTVGGGFFNITNTRHSTIGGGHRNIIQSPTNECCSRGVTISGGIGHNSSGGTLDTTTGDLTGTITCCNAGRFSTISGGLRNCATGIISTIGGGVNNTSSANYSTIGGGRYNTASSCYSTVGGGSFNSACGGFMSTVGGGFCNTASCNSSTITGGANNTSSGYYSTVGGGQYNTASGNCSTVGGGGGNTTSGDFSTVGGGFSNTASGNHTGILGGRNNNTNNCSCAMIVGSCITADRVCTTFVNNLSVEDGDVYIKGLNSTNPLATDADGKIVPGTSDYRLKKNIEPIINSLDVVKRLKGVSYEYTEESNMGGGIKYGFIAQEVKEVIPNVVKYRGKDTDMLMLNYTEIIPWLVEAIKEITSPDFVKENIVFKTETIKSEDNYIKLNYNGTYETTVADGVGNNIYNSDGVLTGDRVVDMGNNQFILFSGTSSNSKFEVLTEDGDEDWGLVVGPNNTNGSTLYHIDNTNNNTSALEIDDNKILLNAVSGGTLDTAILIQRGLIKVGSNVPNFAGVEYSADYSTNYGNRSLVDKEYVDGLLNSYGQVSVITSGVINITTAGTYQSTGLVGTLNAENNGISLGTTDTLAIKNTSGKEQLFKIYASADIDAGNNKRLGIKLALNGTPINETECNAPTGNGTSFAKLVTNWMIRLEPNDEVALWVTNFTNTGNVTLERARIVANTII